MDGPDIHLEEPEMMHLFPPEPAAVLCWSSETGAGLT